MNLGVFKENFKIITNIVIDSLLKERLQDGNIKETIRQAIEEINKGNLESIMELSVENLTSSRLRSNLNTDRLLLQPNLNARQHKQVEPVDVLNFKKVGNLTESQNFKRFVDEKLKSGDNLTSSFDDIAEDKPPFNNFNSKKKKDLLSFISEGENEDSLINSLDMDSKVFKAKKKPKHDNMKPIETKNLQRFLINAKKTVKKSRSKGKGIESWLFSMKTRKTTFKQKKSITMKKYSSRQSLTSKRTSKPKASEKKPFSPFKKNLKGYKSNYLKPVDRLDQFTEFHSSYGLLN